MFALDGLKIRHIGTSCVNVHLIFEFAVMQMDCLPVRYNRMESQIDINGVNAYTEINKEYTAEDEYKIVRKRRIDYGEGKYYLRFFRCR